MWQQSSARRFDPVIFHPIAYRGSDCCSSYKPTEKKNNLAEKILQNKTKTCFPSIMLIRPLAAPF